MITKEQVADLRPGDVVEIHRPDWRLGTTLRGPLVPCEGGLYVGDELVQWDGSGDKRIAWMAMDGAGLTVISRAPRLYVNHDREKPVAGDIARDRDGDAWRRGEALWFLTGCDEGQAEIRRDYHPLTLLWDGETGQVVP